ncbi:MAG: replication initiator protein [Microviridae sp.]|nr:MAG: replication initiator protein [Microviridae sp.]
MCLYPRIHRNRKYEKNAKNGGNIPTVQDSRTLHVPAGCGNCIECRKQYARNWQVRLMEDIKENKNGKFIALTFSNQAIKELSEGSIVRIDKKTKEKVTIPISELEGYEKDNAIAKLAVRRFLERWRKTYKKSVRHWLVTELGHKGTENIHLHGIIWTDESMDAVEKHWKYGFIWKGHKRLGKLINYVSEATVNYIVKYIHKVDFQHKTYKAKVLTSAGIGSNYTNTINSKANKYKEEKTDETYRTRSGHKIALPIYWRNKIYSEEERERLWIEKLDKQERWVRGVKIDISKSEKGYYNALETAREENIRLGYGSDKKMWKREHYERQRREALWTYRVQNAQ